MKKLRIGLLALLSALAAAALCFGFACTGDADKPQKGENGLYIFSDSITFANGTYTYDGTEKEITISGSEKLPSGAKVSYANNNATVPGTYNATATLSCDGYNDKTLSATLTITEGEIVASLSNKSYVYDGTEKYKKSDFTVTPTPSDAEIEYKLLLGDEEVQSAINAGTYTVEVTLTKQYYTTKTLTATLTVEKATISAADIPFSGAHYIYSSGTTYQVSIDSVNSKVPEECTVSYEISYYDESNVLKNSQGNTANAVGEYYVTVIIAGDNYNTYTDTVTMHIYSSSEIATEIVDNAMGDPDPWAYLPVGLQYETKAKEADPTESQDYENSFVNVSDIDTNFIGLQLNVLYSMLSYVDTAMSYINSISTYATQIIGVLQTYLSNNTTDFSSYTTTITGLGTVIIEMTDDMYALLVGNSVIAVEMYYDIASGVHSGRVQITNSIALRYQYSDNYLSIAFKVTAYNALGIWYELEFINSGSSVVGYLFEHLGTAETGLQRTVATLAINDTITCIMSAKRETTDLIVLGYEEVYDSQTGKYLGGEITETVKTADYDTYWFNLADVNGISNVKVGSKVYINNSTSEFEVEKNSILFVSTSRHFDIEMKTVYYVVKTTDEDGNISYSREKTSIPMLFVQKENLSEFCSEVYNKNTGCFTSVPTLTSNVAYVTTILSGTFDSMYNLYYTIKDLYTTDMVDQFIGEKSELLGNSGTGDEASTDGE